MYLTTENELTGGSLPVYLTAEKEFTKDKNTMFKLIYIEEGTGIIELNEKSMVLMAPTLICLSELDEFKLLQENDLKLRVLYFVPYMINSYFSMKNIRHHLEEIKATQIADYYYIRPFVENNQEITGILDLQVVTAERVTQLFDLFEKELANFENRYWWCRSRSFFQEIIFLLLHVFTSNEHTNPVELVSSATELNDVILYLHSNYPEKITIKDLEEKFLLNRTSLSQKFREATGTSIKQYLVKIRLKVATMMLKGTHLPIAEIAFRTGFKDSTHFTRMFKQHLSYLPSEYREQNQ